MVWGGSSQSVPSTGSSFVANCSGSQYDSNGNLRNWWAQDDAKKFEELGQSVVEYYSAQSVRGMQVDGQLTLGENIADLGAMACVSAVAKQRGLDLRKVYAAYANLWAEEVRLSNAWVISWAMIMPMPPRFSSSVASPL